MLKILKKEHNGAIAVENLILLPLMFVTLLMLLYFFFMAVSYITFNNVANNIVTELNMRQSGYLYASEYYQTPPDIETYGTINNIEKDKHLLNYKNISVRNGHDSELININSECYNEYGNFDPLLGATYFALDKYKDGLLIPYNEVTDIVVESNKKIQINIGEGLGTNTSSTMIGNLITVNIKFKTSFINNILSKEITASGYGFIS